MLKLNEMQKDVQSDFS